MRLVSTGASFSGTEHRVGGRPWVSGEWAWGQVGTGPHPRATKLRWGGLKKKGSEEEGLVPGLENTPKSSYRQEGESRKGPRRLQTNRKTSGPCSFGMFPA